MENSGPSRRESAVSDRSTSRKPPACNRAESILLTVVRRFVDGMGSLSLEGGGGNDRSDITYHGSDRDKLLLSLIPPLLRCPASVSVVFSLIHAQRVAWNHIETSGTLFRPVPRQRRPAEPFPRPGFTASGRTSETPSTMPPPSAPQRPGAPPLSSALESRDTGDSYPPR